MALFEFHIETKGFTPFGKRWKSTLNAALRHAHLSMARYWHQKCLPMHFGNAASRRYGYTPRRGEAGSGVPFSGRISPNTGKFQMSYTKKKLKAKGHTRPLEWSGDLKRSTRSFRLTATRNSGACILPYSRKANYRYKGKGAILSSDVYMADELTHVRNDEMAALAKVAKVELAADLNRARGRERINIK